MFAVRARRPCFFVMPGLVPGIHVLALVLWGVDGRVKPGHDDYGGI